MSKFLPEDFIEDVRSANEVTDVISDYLSLKPKGKNFFGLCPFHGEKTPSFSVDPEKQLYHCFGCGEGGNVFSFVMAQEGIDFVDSVKFLARRKGISLPGSFDRVEDEGHRRYRETLYEINKAAALYYHERLLSHEGRQALQYLGAREIDPRIIKTFGIGYAPDSWDSTMNYLLEKGFERQYLLDIGLVIENKQKMYDRFRNRIMFPIIDQRDRVVGFGGRILDDSSPKYLNSPESPVFDKSGVLFGLNLARKKRPIDSFIVVEGYMDVISLYRFGFQNAVASLGTSLTSDQATLMRRYSPNIYLAYDGDAAGQKATARVLDILKNAGCNVKVIPILEGMDPDDILKNQGVEYFDRLIDNSLSLTDYKLNQLQAHYDLNIPEEKVKFATEATPILIDLKNPLERDLYVQKVNSLTGFRSELLYRYMEQLESRAGKQRLKKNIIGNNRHTTTMGRTRLQMTANFKAEMHLVKLMALNEQIAKKIINRLGEYSFGDGIHRKVLDIVKGLLKNDIEFNETKILDYVQEEQVRSKITEIFRLEMEYDNVDRYIDDCVEELQRSQLEKQRNLLMERILDMDSRGEYNSIEYKELVEELGVLNRITKLGPLGKEEVM